MQLKAPPAVVFHDAAPAMGNHVRFRLGPDVAIGLGGSAKRPGDGMVGQPIELALARLHTSDEMDAYERLLGDAMEGDAQLFAREDAVEAAWRVVDPVFHQSCPVYEYDPGTWGPKEANALLGPDGWHNPTASGIGGG